MPFGSAVNDGGAGKSKSPFKAEVWFVSGIARLDLKWGTPVAIQLEDPRYKYYSSGKCFRTIRHQNK